ncbi:MAG TPA: serine hydrolase [Candidatus Baltobacteraceae bacterium]|nr:serine hydrolase [Candidatus Baltobacteraceae bacterium]
MPAYFRALAAVMAAVTMLVAPAVAMAAQNNAPSEASAVHIPERRIDRAIASIDGLASELLRKSGVPGMAVAVVHNDKIVYAAGFGVRKVGTNERVDPNTVFELASVSKSLASTVVAAAVGRGTVKWSDPVAKYVPGFTLSDPYVGAHVTIADMFAHRSGLPDHAGDLLEDLGYNRATIVRRLALEPLEPFRITYNYTNFGLTAAAQAVANANHTTWEELSRDLLYKPLGMNATSSSYADYEKAANKAALHVRIGNTWVAKYTRDADAQSPAGGASSTVLDLARWMRLELANGRYDGKQIVQESALLQTRKPNLVSSPISSPVARASFYGLGMGVSYDETGRLRLTHSGAFAVGAATTYALLPSERLGIVVLTNGMPVGVPETLAAEFLDLAELGSIQRDWYAAYSHVMAAFFVNHSALAGKTPPVHPRPARPASAYAGNYSNAYYGPASIESQNGRLVMVLGPRRERFVLQHWDGETFSYTPVGENAVGISAVTFAKSGAGAETFTVENLDANKLGTFVRVPPS